MDIVTTSGPSGDLDEVVTFPDDQVIISGPSGELDGTPTLLDGRDTTKIVETNLVSTPSGIPLLCDFGGVIEWYQSTGYRELVDGDHEFNLSLRIVVNLAAQGTPSQRNMVLISSFVATMLRTHVEDQSSHRSVRINSRVSNLISSQPPRLLQSPVELWGPEFP
ncbi:hypothetical protein Tco_0917261 [Tanacetum coccineum]